MEVTGYFGEVTPPERWSISYGEYRLVFEPLNAHEIVYRRVRRGQIERELLVALGANRLLVLPIAPMPGPIDTGLLMLRLRPPIALGEGAKLSITVRIPLGVGVFLGDRRLDAFSLAPPKYAVYGSPMDGALCRYIELDLRGEERSSLEGYAELRFVNNVGSPVRVSRIVVPSEGLWPYMDLEGEVYFAGVAFNAVDERSAEVVGGLEPPAPSTRPVLGKKPRITTFVMRYGY